MNRTTPGTVAITTGELGRYVKFTQNLLALQIPVGSQWNWQTTINIAHNLNETIRAMTGEWLFILGDDHSFAPDTLLRLLDHDVDIVVPRCCMRKPPFYPVTYGDRLADGTFPVKFVPPGVKDLVPLYAAGTAGMLIKRTVLDALGPPWFSYGRTKTDELGEDLWFCHRAKQAGFDIFLDPTLAIGHLSPFEVWPSLTGQPGDLALKLTDTFTVTLAIPPPYVGDPVPVSKGS